MTWSCPLQSSFTGEPSCNPCIGCGDVKLISSGRTHLRAAISTCGARFVSCSALVTGIATHLQRWRGASRRCEAVLGTSRSGEDSSMTKQLLLVRETRARTKLVFGNPLTHGTALAPSKRGFKLLNDDGKQLKRFTEEEACIIPIWCNRCFKFDQQTVNNSLFYT